MNALGKKIRLLRHQKGWSQEDVAKQLDISIPAFSKIETGITDVNLSRLDQISRLFGLTVVQLLATNDSEEEKKYISELTIANKKLQERDAEVIKLQKKVIELYEQLHKMRE
ncbi:helix-turn-helix domain-containing protein [Parapedobacter sp. GCM10030251]|jgi:Predicted transcription factor, homolog of eukaryotic MBF1|uniref:helix-turn-helix domain-containing protein n=1 Tax=Parapedobacter sp. GCM10030251 TaxID=3273419 RepID=UPI00360AE1E4